MLRCLYVLQGPNSGMKLFPPSGCDHVALSPLKPLNEQDSSCYCYSFYRCLPWPYSGFKNALERTGKREGEREGQKKTTTSGSRIKRTDVEEIPNWLGPGHLLWAVNGAIDSLWKLEKGRPGCLPNEEGHFYKRTLIILEFDWWCRGIRFCRCPALGILLVPEMVVGGRSNIVSMSSLVREVRSSVSIC